MSNSNESKCPFPHGQMQQKGSGTSNNDWWPNRLNLGILRQHSSLTNPLDEGFNYAEAFKKLDLNKTKKITTLNNSKKIYVCLCLQKNKIK